MKPKDGDTRYGIAVARAGSVQAWRSRIWGGAVTLPRQVRQGIEQVPYSLAPDSPGLFALSFDLVCDAFRLERPAVALVVDAMGGVVPVLVEAGERGVQLRDLRVWWEIRRLAMGERRQTV